MFGRRPEPAPLRPYLLTPCSRVFLEKLPSSQLVKKFSTHIMEPEGSLLDSQVPTPITILSQLDPFHIATPPFSEDQF